MFHSILKPRRLRAAGTALATAVLLAACGGGGSSSDTGTLRLALTDAPSCGYDSVNVTVERIRVHRSSTASETDGGWSEIVLNTPQRFDLLDLQNGVLAELGQTPLPVGKYTQMRLVLAGNGNGSGAPANSVVPSGGAEVALTTPSGQQSGLKMNVNIDIAANRMADFVLDFDACKSVVRAGNSGRYLLKPVVSVIPRYVSGVTGHVDTTLANGYTSVSLQQGGTVVKATTPDATGRFLLQPVAAGTYTLVMTAPGRATSVITGVTVDTDTVTPVTTSENALNLPTSASGIAAGTVTFGTAPLNAGVLATQTLTGGQTIEVAGAGVESPLGAYGFTLPVAPVRVAPYVPAPQPLVFSADPPTAGQYRLVVVADGVAHTPTSVTVAEGATTTTHLVAP